jgi:hypothetical protein
VSGVMNEPLYVDERELARRLPISLITWQNWRRHGGGPPFFRLGRRIVYRWREVVAWLESHRVTDETSTTDVNTNPTETTKGKAP